MRGRRGRGDISCGDIDQSVDKVDNEPVRKVNLPNRLVVSTPQMDENQTNWKSYSIADRATRQFNHPDELYIASAPPGESIVVRQRSLGGHKTSPEHVSSLLGHACNLKSRRSNRTESVCRLRLIV